MTKVQGISCRTMQMYLTLLKVKVTQLCPTLCDPMDNTVHGILQARILEWVAISFSRGSSQPRNQTQVSCIAGRFFTNWATREAQHVHFLLSLITLRHRFPPSSVGKESACNAGDLGLIPALGRCPGEGNGNPLQYSCLRATVHGVAKNWTWLNNLTFQGIGREKKTQGCLRDYSKLPIVWKRME